MKNDYEYLLSLADWHADDCGLWNSTDFGMIAMFVSKMQVIKC